MRHINFDLQQLQAFIAIAERGSFRAAAEHIHLSPPALSRRIEKLESISAGKYKSLKNTTTALNRLDKESADYMKAGEKRCRKIKSGLIPFSPDAVKWIRRKMVYNSLLLLRQGRKKNKGNITRMACGVGISRPMHLSVEEIRTGLQVCKSKCKDLPKTGWLLRQQHLKAQCDSARAHEDHLALQNILAIYLLLENV